MPLSMYQASVPIYLQQLKTLLAILEKAEAHARDKGIDPAELVEARLAPDMFPLSRQVQIVSDQAKNGAARLSGREPPKYEDNETTFPELKARLVKTIDFVGGIKPAEIDGSEDRDVTLTIGGQPRTLKAQHYLVHNALPNFLFHVSTAYGILRHKGVEIGKRDYLGTY